MAVVVVGGRSTFAACMLCREVFRAWVELARKMECNRSLALGIDNVDGTLNVCSCIPGV